MTCSLSIISVEKIIIYIFDTKIDKKKESSYQESLNQLQMKTAFI